MWWEDLCGKPNHKLINLQLLSVYDHFYNIHFFWKWGWFIIGWMPHNKENLRGTPPQTPNFKMRESAVNEMGMGQALGCNSLLSEMRIPYPSHLSRNIMIINHWIGVPLRKSTSRISTKNVRSGHFWTFWRKRLQGVSWWERLQIRRIWVTGAGPKTKIRHHQRAAGFSPHCWWYVLLR